MIRTLLYALKSINQNRLRSFLAGFGIAWGILLLITFLGIGNSFREGVMKLFDGFAQKSLFVNGGRAERTSSKVNAGSMIDFDANVVSRVKDRYPSVLYISEVLSLSGQLVSYNEKFAMSPIQGVTGDYFKIKILDVEKGRAFNDYDNSKCRNVAIVGPGVEQILFKNDGALGKNIYVRGVLFKVIGVLASNDLFSMAERNSVYIPSSSFRANFSSDNRIQSFCMTLKKDANTSAVEQDLRNYLAYSYGFSSKDEQAISVTNIEAQTAEFDTLFKGLEALIWVIGICLLLSGIVGVCNVMLIIVKERTNEIGIRKAVGATHASIINMILSESLAITIISGVIGIVVGEAIIFIGNKAILPMIDSEIMGDLTISMPAIILAFIVLCLSGILSGLFPALRASRISPVDAIRYDNR